MQEISLLNRPHLTSFVAIARIVSVSTIISIIMSVIAIVGVMLVYISSLWKKFSMRPKMSISLSWIALASLAAWGPGCQNWSHKRKMQDTDRKKNANPSKDRSCRWECLKINVRAGIRHDKVPRYSLVQQPGPWSRKMNIGHSPLG